MPAPHSLFAAFVGTTSLVLATGPAWAGPDIKPPIDLKVSQVASSTASFEWRRPADASGSVRYDVRVTPGTWEAIALGTSQSFGGFAAGTTYQVSVRTVDQAGNRSEPATIDFTTVPWSAPAPTAPGNLRALTSGGHLQGIMWDAVPGPITYSLSSGSSFLAAVTGTQVSVDQLVNDECVDPGSTHTLTVQAVGADGQRSAESAPLTVTFP